ncbi:protein of unknown function [bacterium A37T11]|nr:protein of unknown function [bacterium A37T11]
MFIKKRQLFTILSIFCLLNNFVFAFEKIVAVHLNTALIRQYEKAEWTVSIHTTFGNPYLQEDVALNMELKAPSGKKLLLPCYYESGKSGGISVWRSRFLPQENGKYEYFFRFYHNNKLISETSKLSFTTKFSKKKGILHGHDNWTFQFDNGTLFRGLGENFCWESRAIDDSKFYKTLHENSNYNYEYMLPRLASFGANYFRTWINSWNLPLDYKDGINNHRYDKSDNYYHPQAINKLDRLVTLADSLGLYIMLTLGPGSHNAMNGRHEVTMDEFFIDEKSKTEYKNRLRFIVARWGFSPAIGAWEFFNEVDNIQYQHKEHPIPADQIVNWHKEMADYLKSIDPFGHLVTTSISHRDLNSLNSIQKMDFNQKHIYKNTHSIPQTLKQYSDQYHKPYVIGEFGYEWDWSKNFNDFGKEMDNDYKRGLWYGLFSPTPILPMSWWWEYFESKGTDQYLSKVKPILTQMLKSGQGNFKQTISFASSTAIEIYSVQCGAKIYVYLFNPTSSPIETTINVNVKNNVVHNVKIYDCESGLYKKFKAIIINNTLVINKYNLQANSDVVLII